MVILILGVSGMLGSMLMKTLSHEKDLKVYGTLRDMRLLSKKNQFNVKCLKLFNSEKLSNLNDLIDTIKPELIINCIGLVKQLMNDNNIEIALNVNSIFPHKLANICKIKKIRLIHVSTDCVFSGSRGNYVESDSPDARDLYGLSKYLGELKYEHTLTVRTSIIGPELNSQKGLLNWFLAQNGIVEGYKNAIFSGLTTLELSKVIKDYLITNKKKYGIYHVASNPISKFDLLNMINNRYNLNLNIKPSYDLKINRSLNSSLFSSDFNYQSTDWEKQIDEMYKFSKLN